VGVNRGPWVKVFGAVCGQALAEEWGDFESSRPPAWHARDSCKCLEISSYELLGSLAAAHDHRWGGRGIDHDMLMIIAQGTGQRGDGGTHEPGGSLEKVVRGMSTGHQGGRRWWSS
jgi:hypothetical protein